MNHRLKMETNCRMAVIAVRWERQARLLVVVAAFLFALAGTAGAQQPAPGSAALEGFPDLVSGLKAIEGCLGVETARTQSGKQVIFAWFKDKASVLRWYHSDMHQGAMRQFFPNQQYRPPLAEVPDDIGPIMAIASITFSDKARVDATTLPISQIAIELYSPVTGGISLGGRFAPDNLQVPRLKDYGPVR